MGMTKAARDCASAAALRNSVRDATAMWMDLDNGYDAFAIDNSRVTLSDKPGQDTQHVYAGGHCVSTTAARKPSTW